MIAALLLLAASTAAAPAVPPAVDVDATDCDDSSPQQMLNICAANAAASTDAEMNAQWKVTAAEMKRRDNEIDRATDRQPGYFDTLLAGQRAWLAWRYKQCLLESFEMRGGSAAPLIHSGCMERITRQRLDQLKALVGDTGR
jgi:uncharacterized protein YecT (DUF1311 family)